MKPIRPRLQTESPEYPSVLDTPEPTRRDFLRRAAAGAALAGGALWVGDEAEAGRRARPRMTRVTVHLRRGYRYSSCDYVAERIILQTRSPRLARFLKDSRERPALVQALITVLGRHKCADLKDRKRLARLEGRLARAVAQRYRRRTRRGVATPIATLVLGRPRPSQVDGGLGMPSVPVRPPSV